MDALKASRDPHGEMAGAPPLTLDQHYVALARRAILGRPVDAPRNKFGGDSDYEDLEDLSRRAGLHPFVPMRGYSR